MPINKTVPDHAEQFDECGALIDRPVDMPMDVAVALPVDLEKGRILLVEDHDVNQILIKSMIERLGYETDLAVDGADAVAKIDASREHGRPFSLVLMDVQMPVMDGYQTTRMIRACGIAANDLPIIAITASALNDDTDSCLAAGMQAHISKPIMIDHLRSLLTDWLPHNLPHMGAHCGKSQLTADEAEKPHFISEDLEKRYQLRKDEAIQSLAGLIRRASYHENEIREVASHFHKLAGTAAMFGEEDLGAQAKAIENGLNDWRICDRPVKLKKAAITLMALA